MQIRFHCHDNLTGYGRAGRDYILTPVFPGEDEILIDGNVAQVKLTTPAGSSARQMWAEPSLDRLAETMRCVVADWRDGLWLGSSPERRAWYEQNYSFEAIGRKFLNILEEIS